MFRWFVSTPDPPVSVSAVSVSASSFSTAWSRHPILLSLSLLSLSLRHPSLQHGAVTRCCSDVIHSGVLKSLYTWKNKNRNHYDTDKDNYTDCCSTWLLGYSRRVLTKRTDHQCYRGWGFDPRLRRWIFIPTIIIRYRCSDWLSRTSPGTLVCPPPPPPPHLPPTPKKLLSLPLRIEPWVFGL